MQRSLDDQSGVTEIETPWREASVELGRRGGMRGLIRDRGGFTKTD